MLMFGNGSNSGGGGSQLSPSMIPNPTQTSGQSPNYFNTGNPWISNPISMTMPGSGGSGYNSVVPWMSSATMGPGMQNKQTSPGTGGGGAPGLPGSRPVNPGGGGLPPYQVPSSSNPAGSGFTSPYYQDIHGGQTIAPQFPGLSGGFVNFLMSQLGQGMTPFNLSTPLPTGGKTAPGQLTAGENPMLQQLQALLSGGSSNIAGGSMLQSLAGGGTGGSGALNTLSGIANNGINAQPEWQSMIAAMQQPIQQQTANLREQFGSMGDLAGTGFSTAMSNFGQQTALQQESLLGQLQQQNILQGQIPVAQGLAGMQTGAASELTGMGGSLSQYLQGLNQQAIQNQYGEFNRTQPQNNPMIQDILSMSQLYPPTIQTGVGGGGIAGMASGMGQGLGSILDAAGNNGMCWLTSACVEARGLSDDCEELETLRWFRDNVILDLPRGREVVAEYDRIAPRIVSAINSLGADAKRVWNRVYKELVQDAVYLIQHDNNDAALKLYHNYTQRLRMEYL